jgi:hypothetical protein
MAKKSHRPKHSATLGSKPVEDAPPRELVMAAGAVFAVLALLRLAAAQFPAARVWGLNASAWLPVWAQLLIAALGVLAATPLVLRFARGASRVPGMLPLRVTALLFAILAGGVFWAFRMETYFLGDGAVYLSEHFRLLRGLSVSESVLYSIGSAPLTGWLLAQGALLFFSEGSTLAGNPQFVFWIAGAAAGAVFTAMAVLISGRWSEREDERFACTLILLFTPAMLFFFGYVEYYTFAFVGITFTAFLSIEAARGRVAAYWPVLALLLSSALHMMALVLLPGVLLALLAAKEGTARFVTLRNVLLLAAAALAAGGVFYFASAIAFEGSRVILSLVPFGAEGARQFYTLFSAAHIIDVVNMLLLTASPLLAVLPFLRARGWDAAALVGLAHVIFSFFLMFFGYSGFGMARDWDVTAFFAATAALLILTLLRREEAPRRAYLLQLAAWGSVVAVLPWLLVNIDASRSERRFRDIMALDDRIIPGDFALNGYEHLRKYYQSTGDREGVTWAIGKKIEMVGYPSDYRKYALAVIEGVPAEQRAERWAWMLGSLRERLARMREKGTESEYAGSLAEFREVAIELLMQLGQLPQRGGELDALFASESAALRGILGEDPLLAMAETQRVWDRTGVFPGGEAFGAAAPSITTSGTLAFYAGRGLLTAGRHAPAAAALEQSLQLDSSFTLPAYYLAEAEMMFDPPRIDRAIQHYGMFLSTPERHRIANPAAQQQLREDARRKSAELEVRRLVVP